MEERKMLLDLKRNMQLQLEKLETQLILYDPNDDDEKFQFLIKKAAYYRDLLKKIEDQLNEL